MDHVKKFPKARELVDLQARTNYLLKENSELKTWVATQEVQQQEIRALKAATNAELVCAQEDRDRAEAISRKFHKFVGQPGDVVNKAQFYDKGSSHQGTPTRANIVRFFVKYNSKMEKLMREMRLLLQPFEQQPQRPKPAPEATEATLTPVAQSEAPQPEMHQTEAAQPEMHQPEAAQPDEATATGLADPTLAEPIPDDIVSIKQWVAGGLQNLTTPTTRNRGTSLLASQSMPESIQ